MKRKQASSSHSSDKEDDSALKKSKVMKNLPNDVIFDGPAGIFVTPNGEIYIADSRSHRVRKVLQDGRVVTIAGTGKEGYSGDGGPATSAQLNGPFTVFVSSSNEVYIGDCQNYRIRKILRNGNIITIAGNGKEGYSGDGGLAIDAEISAVYSLFVSQKEEVYFTDFYNNIVRKILRNGNIITIVGNGKREYSGDGGLVTNAQIFSPSGIFVTPNDEVYFTEFGNNIIRKIENNLIMTVAGTGKEGYGGDGGPATSAQLSSPRSVFVSSNNEIYIGDTFNYRIRKILRNGTIITIAGNGKEGYSGDGGLAIDAEISDVFSLFVSQKEEVYFTDGSSRIRKILRNGNIITIAGNGKRGYSRDSKFDFLLHPHIGNAPNTSLKKFSRDEILGLNIIGHIPLIEKITPQFAKIILRNEKLLVSLNLNQQKIVQELINYIIYEKKTNFEEIDILDILFILGMFKNCEFMELKRSLVSQLLSEITIETAPSKWEKTEKLLTLCKDFLVNNYILEKIHNYFLEYFAMQMMNPKSHKYLIENPIVTRYSSDILARLTITQASSFNVNEVIEIEPQGIEILFNDVKSSDVKIEMGQDTYLYCHKTILSSSSTFFNALFDSGSSYSDLSDGIFTPDKSEDLEMLEIIIKSCYGIPCNIVTEHNIIRLLDIAMKHEDQYLIKLCKNTVTLTIDNYFTVASRFEKYLHLDCFECFLDDLISFGIQNSQQLLTDRHKVAQLPEDLRNALIVQMASSHRR